MRPTYLLLLPLWLTACREEPKTIQASIEQTPGALTEPDAAAAPTEPDAQPDAQPGTTGAMVPPLPEGVTDPLEIMRDHVSVVAQRKEHDAQSLKVQHILIAHGGAGLPGVRRPIADAEQLAAETYLELIEGADFMTLLEDRSDDTGGGVYGMYTGQSAVPGYMPRRGMVGAFGDVAWRLEVGQIGVAPLDPKTSPYGWHIIQRIE